MKRVIITLMLLIVGLHAQDVLIFSTENRGGKITPKSIEKAFRKHGFEVSANRDMNMPFKKQFGETTFDVYNLFTTYHLDVVKNLINNYPDIGLFSPLSLSIWTKKGEKRINVAVLSAAALAKITGIPANNSDLQKLEKLVRSALKDAMPDLKEEMLEYKVKDIDRSLVTRYSAEIDAEDYEDAKGEFMMLFESELDVNGFVVAGFNDLEFALSDRDIETNYDFFDVESVCKLPVIYTISKIRPEAGAFAPCSMYFYKKRGDDRMHIAYPNVYNWVSSLHIDDKESLDTLEDAQVRIVNILDSATE